MGHDYVRDDETTATPTRTLPVSKKFRRTLSCLNCQRRKVKCDRVKPCRACCTRGAPSECEYGTTKKDRHFIDQSDLIEQLQERCSLLEKQLADVTKGDTGTMGSGIAITKSPWVEGKPVATEHGRHFDSNEESVSWSGTAAKSLAVERQATVALMADLRRQKLQQVLSASPSPGKVFMEIFVAELINGFCPQPHIYEGSVFDMRAAAEMRIFSPLLSSAFGAASLAFIGQRDQHAKIAAAGNSQYSRVLGLLQRAVNDPEQCRSTEVLVVVVLFTIIEALKQNSKNAVLKHQLGGLELLRLRTPYRHRTGLDRSLYVDLRMFWVSSAIVSRQPTFLAIDEWKTVPWPEGGPPKDVLHHLLDIAVDIPTYLAGFDNFKSAVSRCTVGSTKEILSMQTVIGETATELDKRLRLWSSVHASTYPLGSVREVFDVEDDEKREGDDKLKFPRFQCRKSSTGELIIPPLLVYPDLLLATSMCFYRALRLVLVAMDDTGLVTALSLHERYQLACDICRSMRYYLQTVPGFLISRMMFPLRIAYDTFSDGMAEKEFIRDIFVYIGNKYQLSVFRNSCSESAVSGRTPA